MFAGFNIANFGNRDIIFICIEVEFGIDVPLSRGDLDKIH